MYKYVSLGILLYFVEFFLHSLPLLFVYVMAISSSMVLVVVVVVACARNSITSSTHAAADTHTHTRTQSIHPTLTTHNFEWLLTRNKREQEPARKRERKGKEKKRTRKRTIHTVNAIKKIFNEKRKMKIKINKKNKKKREETIKSKLIKHVPIAIVTIYIYLASYKKKKKPLFLAAIPLYVCVCCAVERCYWNCVYEWRISDRCVWDDQEQNRAYIVLISVWSSTTCKSEPHHKVHALDTGNRHLSFLLCAANNKCLTYAMYTIARSLFLFSIVLCLLFLLFFVIIFIISPFCITNSDQKESRRQIHNIYIYSLECEPICEEKEHKQEKKENERYTISRRRRTTKATRGESKREEEALVMISDAASSLSSLVSPCCTRLGRTHSSSRETYRCWAEHRKSSHHLQCLLLLVVVLSLWHFLTHWYCFHLENEVVADDAALIASAMMMMMMKAVQLCKSWRARGSHSDSCSIFLSQCVRFPYRSNTCARHSGIRVLLI